MDLVTGPEGVEAYRQFLDGEGITLRVRRDGAGRHAERLPQVQVNYLI